MPIQINPASQLYSFFEGTTAAGATSNSVFRGWYTQHSIQVSTSGATAQSFVLYASNDANVWTAIRDQTDVDSTVTSYSGANASGMIFLSGSYPWLRIVTGTASTNPFTATIYSTDLTNI